MLIPTKQILDRANKHGYAVGAFNIYNLEVLQAIIEAVESEKSPVIIQTSEAAIEYAGMESLVALVKIAADKTSVSVSLHLDHGKDLEVVKRAINCGYTSVMFDGSKLPYEENAAKTKEVCDMAHEKGVSVEAELGVLAGVEDKAAASDKEAFFTDPKQAADFVKKTGCDFLAISIGTSHGAHKFKGAAELDLARLKEIKQIVEIPLVLHGASSVPDDLVALAKKYGAKLDDTAGVPDELLRKAVSLGINKVNIDSDLRIAFIVGVRKFLDENPEVIDPRKILSSAKNAVCEVVKEKIKLLRG
jgi:fructose-bisphosphate aldolase class II